MYMYRIVTLMALFFASVSLYAGTCTSISRTNASANTVLTSTKYNTDLNTVYTHTNAFDGGCITDGTLEAAALNSTDFAFLNKGIHQGCEVSKSNDSTISVDRCHLSVNGNFVSTTSANTETFGCTGCSSETTDTVYYVYAKSDSTGTTLNLLLLTSAPNADGFDGSGNRVLGRIYNNASGNIEAYSIAQWHTNKYNRPFSQVRLHTGNGYGSTSTYFRRFATIIDDFGSDITYADSSTDGASFTINTDGIYSISYSDYDSGGNNYCGLTLNPTNGTTEITGLAAPERLSLGQSNASSNSFMCQGDWTGFLKNGDVIRAHAGQNKPDDATALAAFTIVRIH